MNLTLLAAILLAVSSLSVAQNCVCGTYGRNYTEDDIVNAEKKAQELGGAKKTLHGYPKPIIGTKNTELRDRCGPTDPLYEFPLRHNNQTYDGNGYTSDRIIISGVTKDDQPGVGTYCGCITTGKSTFGDAYRECKYE
ncbi:hypothetical protein PM082_006516 [Marasmius tenuissimus]|nr:hypothetical protein PM082_006516 [Marasmius tenuissimus]